MIVTGQSGVSAETLASLSTPDSVESRLGALQFTEGAPAPKTVEILYDHLDFVHGLNAFLTAFPAASTQAMRQGFLETVHSSPEQPAGAEAGIWIQTAPDKGFFAILRPYSPLQPFFDKSWRVGEIELSREEAR